MQGLNLEQSLIEVIGGGDMRSGSLNCRNDRLAEVFLRLAVRDARRAAVEQFCRELAPLITSRAAGYRGLRQQAGRRRSQRLVTGLRHGAAGI